MKTHRKFTKLYMLMFIVFDVIVKELSLLSSFPRIVHLWKFSILSKDRRCGLLQQVRTVSRRHKLVVSMKPHQLHPSSLLRQEMLPLHLVLVLIVDSVIKENPFHTEVVQGNQRKRGRVKKKEISKWDLQTQLTAVKFSPLVLMVIESVAKLVIQQHLILILLNFDVVKIAQLSFHYTHSQGNPVSFFVRSNSDTKKMTSSCSDYWINSSDNWNSYVESITHFTRSWFLVVNKFISLLCQKLIIRVLLPVNDCGWFVKRSRSDGSHTSYFLLSPCVHERRWITKLRYSTLWLHVFSSS